MGILSWARLALFPTAFAISAAYAQPQGIDLVSPLRAGGYVIVLRHARSPRTPPDPGDARPDNVDLERQLDAVGRADAAGIGATLRALRIPIGEIVASPTFRARETVRELGVGDAVFVDELGDGGVGMQSSTDAARSGWLRELARGDPGEGTNTLVVTHLPNITGAFGAEFGDLAEGDALIVDPRGGIARVLGRVRVDDWRTAAPK